MYVITVFAGGIIGPFTSEKAALNYLRNYVEGRGNVQMLVAPPARLT